MSATLNPGAGVDVEPAVVGTEFTISNTGVLSVNGLTGDVTVPAGPTGATGPTGPAGAPGAPGATGPTGAGAPVGLVQPADAGFAAWVDNPARNAQNTGQVLAVGTLHIWRIKVGAFSGQTQFVYYVQTAGATVTNAWWCLYSVTTAGPQNLWTAQFDQGSNMASTGLKTLNMNTGGALAANTPYFLGLVVGAAATMPALLLARPPMFAADAQAPGRMMCATVAAGAGSLTTPPASIGNLSLAGTLNPITWAPFFAFQ